MTRELLDSLKLPCLINGERVLAAVSGGADSVALLQLLHRLAGVAGVAHFDHQTREGASAEEGAFVRQMAQSLGLPCYMGARPIAALAEGSGESFEMVARRERYAFLRDTAKEHGFTAVATGHHADDQAETVLMRLLRGAGPTGLGGIRSVREEAGVRFIRPLLGISRAALVQWLAEEGIPWREDASNADSRFERNRVRHELLPLLARDYNPGIADALNRLAHLQRLDDDLLTALTQEALSRCVDPQHRLLREVFCALDPALQFRCMVACIQAAGGDSSHDSVTRAVAFVRDGAAGRQADLGNGATIHLAATHGIIVPPERGSEAMEQEYVLPVPGMVRSFGRTFRARRLDALPEEPLATYCHGGRQVFDGDQLGPLQIRRRRAGDRFQPLGMAGTRKLKDVFNDLGFTRPERSAQLLLTSDGTIVWIAGYTISNNVAVTGQTRHWIEVTIE